MQFIAGLDNYRHADHLNGHSENEMFTMHFFHQDAALDKAQSSWMSMNVRDCLYNCACLISHLYWQMLFLSSESDRRVLPTGRGEMSQNETYNSYDYSH